MNSFVSINLLAMLQTVLEHVSRFLAFDYGNIAEVQRLVIMHQDTRSSEIYVML